MLNSVQKAIEDGYLRDLTTIYINATNTYQYQIDLFNNHRIRNSYLPFNNLNFSSIIYLYFS